MSDEKTLITHSSKSAKFLGYSIHVSRDKSITKNSNGLLKRHFTGKVQLLVPKGTIEKVITNRKMVKDINARIWKTRHRPSLIRLSDLEIIETYNAELRGMYNYYALALNVSEKMWQLNYVMEYSCLKTLASKYKSSVAKMRNKYRTGKHWGIKYQTKQGQKIAHFYKDGFKRKKTTNNRASIDTKANLLIFQGTTELEQRINARKCELCGDEHPNTKFEIHHINKLKNLKGKNYWEIVMIARQRKTLVLCRNCHKEIHRN
ncbi:HNH endonuclease [Enterococcus avium]